MNNNRLSLALLGGLLAAPLTLHAQSGWTGYGSVVELIPSAEERYVVKLNVADNPSDCKTTDTFYQDYSASGAAQMFRTLLEAVASDKRVRVFVTGNCELNGYSQISSVGIQP